MKYALVLLLSTSAFASEALDKAQEAAYIQTGLKANVEKIQNYAKTKAERAGVPVVPLAAVYRIYETRTIRAKYHDCTLTASETSVAASVQFHF